MWQQADEIAENVFRFYGYASWSFIFPKTK